LKVFRIIFEFFSKNWTWLRNHYEGEEGNEDPCPSGKMMKEPFSIGGEATAFPCGWLGMVSLLQIERGTIDSNSARADRKKNGGLTRSLLLKSLAISWSQSPAEELDIVEKPHDPPGTIDSNHAKAEE
jgi:hypothetical protein